MIEELSKLYTDEQIKRISAALGDKPEPADLAPRFLIALNERNLEKVGDHLSEDVRRGINQVIGALKLWLNGLITLVAARAAANAARSAFYAARDNRSALDPRSDFLAAVAALDAFDAYKTSSNLSADSSADIGNREYELEWQVNKLIELIGGEA